MFAAASEDFLEVKCAHGYRLPRDGPVPVMTILGAVARALYIGAFVGPTRAVDPAGRLREAGGLGGGGRESAREGRSGQLIRACPQG